MSNALTHKEMIPILAEILGVPFRTAWVIDRSLADAGLRRKHKGPRPPAMTRVEALHFLMGCMLTRDTPTKAGEAVAHWIENAKGWLTAGYESGDDVLEEFDVLGATPTPEIVEANKGRLTILSFEMGRALGEVSGYKDFDLVDTLLKVTRWASSAYVEPSSFKFIVSSSHMHAEMQWHDRNGHHGHVFFQVADDANTIVKSDHEIQTSTMIYGGALEAIANRTADPLDSAD